MGNQTSNEHREAIEAIQAIQAIQLMSGLDSWKEKKIAEEQSILDNLGSRVVAEAKEIMTRRRQEMKDLAEVQAKIKRKPLTEEQIELGYIYWF